MKRAVSVGTSPFRRSFVGRRSDFGHGVRRALLLLGLLGTTGAPPLAAANGRPAPTGAVVGEFELAAPATSAFILRGTLPVLPGTFPRTDGKAPFSIRDSSGALVPAQVDAVTFFPDEAQDGADVVELTAPVHLPAGTAAGTRIKFQVVDAPHTPSTFSPTPAVQALFATPGTVKLRTRDVFGHTYLADLLRGADDVRLLRSGPYREQVCFYEVMRPTATNYGPPSGPLRRMMGVHSYVSTWAGEDLVSLDLRIHNGTSGADKQDPIDDPQDKLYFDQLELIVPQGWTVVPDVVDVGWGTPVAQGTNTVQPIVKALPGNDLHVLPKQAQFHRRLVLAPTSAVARADALVKERWLGFCQPGANANAPYLSWWNRYTARYFPQRHALPRYDFKGKAAALGKLSSQLQGELDWLLKGTAKGGYPFYSPQLGWAYPYGTKYGGMTGGADIYLYDGTVTAWAASNEGYRHSQLTHRTYTDRQSVALYDKDGRPTTLDTWLIQGSQFEYVHMEFYLTLLPGPDPFGFSSAPQYQVQAVASQGRAPSYEAELLSYKPIDVQHHVRWLRSPKVLTWLGNDALAKDDLLMEAEILRLSYHAYPNSPSGGTIPSGMAADIHSVETKPGVGFACGRGEAWTIDGMCAAYSVASPSWRARARDWFGDVVSLMRAGQSECNGFLMRLKTNKDFNGQYFVRRATETAMLDQSVVAMIETVFRGVDYARTKTLEDVLTKQAYGLISPMSWDTAQNGPIASIAIAPLTGAPYCGSTPAKSGLDKFQSWNSLAYAYELTADPVFLQRAAEMSGANTTPDLLTAQQAMSWTNHENRAGLLALAQLIWAP